jgi:hypothetical protein
MRRFLELHLQLVDEVEQQFANKAEPSARPRPPEQAATG